eukprot:c16904_g1_i1 orf=285-929(-)
MAGGKMVNPNDSMENEAFFGKGSDEGSVNHGVANESTTRPTSRHQRRASRDDAEFGLGNQGFNAGHGRHSSRGEEDSFSQHENGSGMDRASVGSGFSPIHPQVYGGRLGKKPGSASPAVDKKSDAVAPGTPSRNRPERYAAPLPKFGDWDVNNPSAGEGFTVIFDKARDEKKTGGALRIQDSPLRPEPQVPKNQPGHQESSHWFCRCFQPSTTA